MPTYIRTILAEPLTHFAVIGVLLYGASLALAPEKVDPRLIRIDHQVQSDLAAAFEKDRGRLPGREEMDKLVETYLRNEVLFREARSLQLDHGDPMMHERLAQRMRLMMYSGIVVPEPEDAVLRAWFEKHRERFRIPAHLTFDVVGLDGAWEEAERLAAAAAEAGEAFTPRAAGVRALMTRLKDRPRNQLVPVFGETFVDAVAASPIGAWTPVDSPRGWQVIRLVAKTEPIEPPFEDVRDAVWSEWRNDEHQKEAIAALKALMASYPIEREPYAADVILSDEPEAAPGAGQETGGAAQRQSRAEGDGADAPSVTR